MIMAWKIKVRILSMKKPGMSSMPGHYNVFPDSLGLKEYFFYFFKSLFHAIF